MQTEDQHEEVGEYLVGNQSLFREALPQKMDEGEDQRASKGQWAQKKAAWRLQPLGNQKSLHQSVDRRQTQSLGGDQSNQRSRKKTVEMEHKRSRNPQQGQWGEMENIRLH